MNRRISTSSFYKHNKHNEIPVCFRCPIVSIHVYELEVVGSNPGRHREVNSSSKNINGQALSLGEYTKVQVPGTAMTHKYAVHCDQ